MVYNFFIKNFWFFQKIDFKQKYSTVTPVKSYYVSPHFYMPKTTLIELESVLDC